MRKNNKIVIIEDDGTSLKALKIELLKNGFEVLIAKDGSAGLSLVKKEIPDLILLDLVLPKKHGFDLLKDLKKDEVLKKIPVIIITNLGQDAEKAKGIELGALDYYIKASTNLTEVTKKINKMFS